MNWNGWRTRISPPDASTMSSDECYSAILKMCEQPVSNPLDTERERRWTSRQRLTVACALRDEIERGVYTYALHVRRSCQTQRQSPLQQQHTKEREREGLIPPDKPTFTSFFSPFFIDNLLIYLLNLTLISAPINYVHIIRRRQSMAVSWFSGDKRNNRSLTIATTIYIMQIVKERGGYKREELVVV